MGIGPLLTYALSATGALVIADLGISAAQFGLLATITFSAAAALALTLGRLSDRFSVRSLLVAVFSGAAAAFVLAAVSTNYIWLLGAMVLSGAAQALSNPATNRAISERAPQAKSGPWIGIKQSGVQASQLLAGVGCPALAVAWDWRAALWVGAVLAAGTALAAWRYTPHGAPRPLRSPPVASAAGARLPRAVWLFTAYAFLSGTALQATNVYLPLFAHEAMGLGLTVAGWTAAGAGAVGVASRIGWARVLNLISGFGLLAVLAGGSTLGALLLMLAPHAQTQALLWAGVALHGATALAANVILMASVVHTVDKPAVGQASSVIAVGLYLGFACGPIAMGLLRDITGAFTIGWSAAAGLYIASGALAVFGARYRGGSIPTRQAQEQIDSTSGH